jgi:hypothetical protein
MNGAVRRMKLSLQRGTAGIQISGINIYRRYPPMDIEEPIN